MPKVTDELLAARPSFHGVLTHSLVAEALALIERTVGPQHRTLETGAGFSTVVFAASGARHTTIVYTQSEVDGIRGYCEQLGIVLDNVTFVVARTERALPGLEMGELDLVLLDGSHAFPGVFIEWFYTAKAIRVGGQLIIDDIHLWTGRTLRNFLAGSPGWQQTNEFRGRTGVFIKTAPVELDEDWSEQPYVYRRSLGPWGVPIKMRQAVSMLRRGQLSALVEEARRVLVPRS